MSRLSGHGVPRTVGTDEAPDRPRRVAGRTPVRNGRRTYPRRRNPGRQRCVPTSALRTRCAHHGSERPTGNRRGPAGRPAGHGLGRPPSTRTLRAPRRQRDVHERVDTKSSPPGASRRHTSARCRPRGSGTVQACSASSSPPWTPTSTLRSPAPGPATAPCRPSRRTAVRLRGELRRGRRSRMRRARRWRTLIPYVAVLALLPRPARVTDEARTGSAGLLPVTNGTCGTTSGLPSSLHRAGSAQIRPHRPRGETGHVQGGMVEGFAARSDAGQRNGVPVGS